MRSNLFIEDSKKLAKLWIYLVIFYLIWMIVQKIICNDGIVGYSNVLRANTLTENLLDIFTLISFGAICAGDIYRTLKIYREFEGFVINYRKSEEAMKLLKTLQHILIAIMVSICISWLGGFVIRFDVFTVLLSFTIKGAYLYYLKKFIDTFTQKPLLIQ